ncbi:MAG: alpha/beta fold hydrolase [Isosphaeraceae bacterium]
MSLTVAVPLFEAHPWFRNGHVQTIAGRFLPSTPVRLRSSMHVIDLDDGDRLSVVDSVPEGWTAGEPLALLVHGLAGNAKAAYVARVASRLVRLGIRAVRMNLRGAGSGFGLARGIYHGGRTEDLRAVVDWLAERAPGSPIGLVGFSLGGNLVLKLAAEAASVPLAGLDCVLAANPPLDLGACCRHIQQSENRVYDRHFVKMLREEIRKLHAAFPDLGPIDLSQVKTVQEFDEAYTAPRNGFASAAEYYQQASAGPLVPQIKVPGLVVHAEDDPFIPPEPFRAIEFPPQLALELIPGGGHLGYLCREPWQGVHRWLDVRLTSWMAEHWALEAPKPTRRSLRAAAPFPLTRSRG